MADDARLGTYVLSMTRYETISAVLNFAALVAIGLTLVLLRRQLILMRRQTDQLGQTLALSAESALDTLFIAVTQAYLEDPELRATLSPGEQAPKRLSRKASLKASSVAELLCDAMERSLNFRRAGLEHPAHSLRAWIEDSFQSSEYLRTWLLRRERWYSDELTTIARRAANRARRSPRHHAA